MEHFGRIISGIALGTMLFVMAGAVPGGFVSVAHAASPGVCPGSLIPCGCDGPDANTTVDTPEQCTFNDFVVLAQNVINFLIFKIASPLAAIMFAWAGFLYVTNNGNEGQVKRAHDIFTYVFIGLVLALAAYLIVYFVLRFFVSPANILLMAP
jgi:hypothetical protein